MKQLAVILVSILLLSSANAQQNSLSLEDAILKSKTDLAADRFAALQWVAETDEVCHISDDGTELWRFSPKSKKQITKISVSTLNNVLGTDMKRMPYIKWSNANEFYFTHKNAYYSYNMKSQKGSTSFTYSDKAANPDFHAASGLLAYTRNNNLYITGPGKGEVAITSNSNKNIVSGQAIARYEFGIRKGTFWSPKGNSLAFYQKDESAVTEYPLLDISSTPGTLRTIKYPMAGQGSEKASAGVYHLQSGLTVYLDTKGEKDQYLTNLAWGPEGRFIYLAVLNRDQNHMKLNKYDALNGKLVKTLFEERNPKYVEPEHPVWFIPNNNNELVWFSERDGYTHLYRYNTEGQLLGQLTKGKWEVDQILGLTNSGSSLIVAGTDETGLNRYAYRVDLKSGETTKLSKKSGIHTYKMDDDGMLLIDQYSSLKTPHVTDIITTRGKRVENVKVANNPLRNVKVGTTELVKIKADDGTILHARMIKPSNFNPARKYPVFVYVYGGPHAQMVTNSWLAGAPLWMHYMAEKGYIVWTLDNRGSKNRGFEFESIIHRQLGTVEMKDQLAGVKYLKSLPYVQANQMAVHGWSYGGFMTLNLMLRTPGTFQVGVAGGPVTDWKYYEVMYGERYMDRPEQNEGGYSTSSLMSHAKNLEGDLLLIHGSVDDVVVMQHNLSLIQKFVEAGEMVDFFVYPMHPHNVRGKDRIHLMNKVLSYIDEQLRWNQMEGTVSGSR